MLLPVLSAAIAEEFLPVIICLKQWGVFTLEGLGLRLDGGARLKIVKVF